MRQQHGWKIAFGLSSLSNFQTGQGADTLTNYAKFTANYEINGGPNDGLLFPLTLRLCTSEDWEEFYDFRESQKDMIQQHID